jgi:hypothetical protein
MCTVFWTPFLLYCIFLFLIYSYNLLQTSHQEFHFTFLSYGFFSPFFSVQSCVLPSSGGQISTKHLKTSIRPFFATCRLPQYPEFWRCYRPRHTFLGPHCKRSLKSLDTMLKVPMRNTQLLPLPRKMVAVVLNIFFWGVYMFFIWGIQCGNDTVSDRGKWREIL